MSNRRGKKPEEDIILIRKMLRFQPKAQKMIRTKKRLAAVFYRGHRNFRIKDKGLDFGAQKFK